MAENGRNAFAKWTNAWLFDASCDGGTNKFEIRVHGDFKKAEAKKAAEKYGEAAGRLPKVLRSGIGRAKGVRILAIHKGSYPWSASRIFGKINIYTERRSDSEHEEIMFHEAAHVSLDDGVRFDSGWKAAQRADGKYISAYAEDNSSQEDVAESFLAYFAARYVPRRITSSWKKTILETIPNRIAYFDALLSAGDMRPFGVSGQTFAALPSVSIAAKAASVTEGGGAVFTLTASPAPRASLTVGVTVTEAGGYASAGKHRVTIPKSGTAELVIATAGDEADKPDGSVTATIGTGLAWKTAASPGNAATVAVTDDDAAALAVAPAKLTVVEGGAAGTFTVKLATKPAAEVTVTVAGQSGTDLTVDADDAAKGTQAAVAFTGANWNTARTVSVTAADDSDANDDTVVLTLTASGGGYASVTGQVTVAVTDDDSRGVTASKDRLVLDETDRAAQQGDPATNEKSYTVVLDSRPMSKVTVEIAVPQNAPVTVDKAELEFDPADWDKPQKVTVTAKDDAVDNAGDRRIAMLAHGVSGGDYGSNEDFEVKVTVNDDDAAPSSLTLSVDADTGESGVQGSVTENGGAKTVRVTATLDGTARFDTAKTVTVEVGNAGDTATEGTDYAAVADGTITVPAGAASGYADFTLTPTNDALDEPDETISIEGQAAGLAVASTSIGIADDDATAVVLSLPDATATEGDTDATASILLTLGRALAKGESLGVPLSIAGGAVGTDYSLSLSGTPAGVTLAGETVTFAGKADGTVSATTATVLLTALDDEDGADDTLTVSIPATDSGNGPKLAATGLGGGAKGSRTGNGAIAVTDDEIAALAVAPAKLAVVEGGAAGTFTVKLATKPTAKVTVTVAGQSGTELTVDADDATNGDQASVSFTATNWNTARTVSVTAADDSDATDDTATLTLTAAGGGYASVTGEVAVTVTDDEGLPGVTLSATALALRELDDADGEGAWTVRLNTDPGTAATVTVTVPEAKRGKVAVQAPGGTPGHTAVLNFTPGSGGTWDDPRTVTVRALNDADIANETVVLAHAANAASGDYKGLSLSDRVTVKVTDAGHGAIVDPAAVSVRENGGAVNYAIRLKSAPGGPVVITPTSGDGAKASVSGALGFDDDNWDDPQEVTVTGGAGTGEVTVSHAVTTATKAYPSNTAVASVTVTVAADTRPAVTLSVSDGGMVAEGGSLTVTATLDEAVAPEKEITIPLVYTDGTATAGADYTEANGITIAAGETSGTAVVAIADDGAGEEAETFTVALGALPEEVRAAETVSAEITVVDRSAIPVVTVAGGAAVTEGEAAPFTLRAAPAPAADLAVLVTVNQKRGYAAPGELGERTVTIPAGEANVGFTVATEDDGKAVRYGQIRVRVRPGAGYELPAHGRDALGTVDVRDNDVLHVAVSDAHAKEGPKARLVFTVTLSEARERPVRVRYRTRDVTAKAGEDYRRKSGKMTFAPGETEKTVGVRVLDDAHDEGEETMELVLTEAVGSRWQDGAGIVDDVGVGTIENSDPLPEAWLARFGRTVAGQALDAVSHRISTERMPGLAGTLAGEALPNIAGDGSGNGGDGHGDMAEREAMLAMAGVARRFDGDGHDPDDPFGDRHGAVGARSMTSRDLLLGTSFALTGQEDASGGTLAFWGRVAQNRFDGSEDDFALDGEVTTGLLGMDYARGRWLVGLALAESAGKGGYSKEAAEDVEAVTGKLESKLTAALPWAAWQASRRLTLWGAAGYGAGEVTLTPGDSAAMKADLDWRMAAAGARAALVEPAHGGGAESGTGPALDLVSDMLWTRTASDRAAGMAAAEADVTRLRLGLEGTWHVALDGGAGPGSPAPASEPGVSGASIMPRLSVGARHDGGDAETGFGVELGGGIAWIDPKLGLQLDVEGRTLLAHEADGLKDRGVSAGLAFDPDPATERGPSLTLRQDWGGQAGGGLDALFAPEPLEDRAASEEQSRWTIEGAWGFPALRGHFTGSPHVGLGLAGGTRDYTLGWRLTPESDTAGDASFALRATRSESGSAGPEHTLGFESRASLGGGGDLSLGLAAEIGAGAGATTEHRIGFDISARW